MFYLVFAVLIVYAIYSRISNHEKIGKYIAEKGGTLVSKKKEYFDWTFFFGKYAVAYKVTYYDKNKNLRAVLVRFGLYGVTFSSDHKVHPDDEKYLVPDGWQQTEENTQGPTIKNPLLTDYHYKSDKGNILIRQKHFQPNKGEEVYLNGLIAPTGKYKIGFMNFVHVMNGRVAELSSF